ncbi:LytR/AlgR family response regulator transcription factor [Chondrinema litorale]|uniref:LytR/AlgR family response regulator transcription factor n=1 Tax=Chondrinema litorale TaxID=2994555 RepID=UPI0025427271|nr:LytTR family DNA-binding domain-containing protein [Chondrinema litorale]UZR97373.1 LytTR family DNA-binding domain-containing protein [Chondrinema litorale]
MNVLIIEDEVNLARQLVKLLTEIDPKIKILSVVDSIQSAVAFISKTENINLILVDIYLNDGLSFEIFEQVECKSPVIFCTAYDQYALKAFELDSVDYLLKPIKKLSLQKAVDKYKRLFLDNNPSEEPHNFSDTVQHLYDQLKQEKRYQKNFLLPYKDRLVPVGVSEISYFQADYGMVKCVTDDSRLFPLDQSLDAVAEKLDPNNFYRVNRRFIVKRDSIVDVEYYVNRRLHLNISPKPQEPVIISKAKVTEFKQWMNVV